MPPTDRQDRPSAMTFDFVSDVVCPWCVIGLRGLEIAIGNVGDLVDASIRFHPFELNPAMPPEGQDIAEHVVAKYGASPAERTASRNAMRDRAAGVGFDMAMRPGARIYNSFDAHRLLHWAGIEGGQRALQHALFAAYFTDGADPSNHDLLVAAAERAGLDGATARAVLVEDRYAEDVRAAERHWRADGISAVPTVIINDRYVINGGQPPAAFERAIRTIAAEAAAAEARSTGAGGSAGA